MTFTVQGLNGQEIVPLEKLFKPVGVTKTEAIAAEHPIDEREHQETLNKNGHNATAEHAYRAVKELPQESTVATEAARSLCTPLLIRATINIDVQKYRLYDK